MALYVQYGCGLSAPDGWLNFDASPTLRLQKLPLIGRFIKREVPFPKQVKYGNIIKGLPGISPESCDGVYCSHVLEHLSQADCRTAVFRTWEMLKPGARFRCVVPDLAAAARNYLQSKDKGDKDAAHAFMQQTMLGVETRPAGLVGAAATWLGNSKHLWMWDHESLSALMYEAGFSSVRNCAFNDSEDQTFQLVEDIGRFHDAVALEAIK